MTDQVITKPLSLSGGRVMLPEMSDLSSQVDWDKVRRYALA